jgi:6-phosphogluconolactonase
MNKSVNIFSTPYELAEKFAEKLISMINDCAESNKVMSVALSGGSTPELLFSLLGDHFSRSARWDYVHLFWGDERCVPPDDPESNFGMAKRKFIDKINIPMSNIHRIRGEEMPEEEAIRYAGDISANTRLRNGLPIMDLIILGLGEDGHTASIFPENRELLKSGRVCEVAIHPVTSRKRVTITGPTINNAASVAFLITGKKKAPVVESILNKRESANKFPASYIDPVHGELCWFIDSDAGSLL